MNIKVKEIVKYNGHSLSANGSVNLSFKAMYGELTNTIKTMQMLNNDVMIIAKVGKNKFKLGMFRIKDIRVGGDGESTIKFNGLSDCVEMDNLNELPLRDSESQEFPVLMSAEIEEEENEDNE